MKQYNKEHQHIRIGHLITKMINRSIDSSELDELNSFLSKDEHNKIVYQELLDETKRAANLEQIKKFDGELAFARFAQKVNRKQDNKDLWKRIASAAATITIISFVLYLYNPFQKVSKQPQLYSATDALPGGNRATLKLADGQVIDLANQKAGTSIKENGIKITKTKDGQLIYSVDHASPVTASGYNTISTPKGGQYQIVLPDHSTVWLNAASTISYATSLKDSKDGKRRVTLNGEAYFEVAKDKAHPFVVVTNEQELEVLGTHFNISSYNDELSVRTTLLEGSVKVQTKGKVIKAKILKPGQQSITTTNNISVDPADIESVMAWKNDLFAFHDADVPTIMRQLSRWYNVDIDYDGAIPTDLFTGGISRKSNLSTVLKMLDLIKIKTAIVQTREGKKIIVYPSSRK